MQFYIDFGRFDTHFGVLLGVVLGVLGGLEGIFGESGRVAWAFPGLLVGMLGAKINFCTFLGPSVFH